MKKFLNKILFGLVTMLMLGVTVMTGEANAISSEEAFVKILVNNVQYCYDNALISGIDAKSYTGFNSLMNQGFKNAATTDKGRYIPTISNSYNNMTENDINNSGRLTSCYAIFAGDASGSGLSGSMKGLFEIYNKAIPSGSSNITALNTMMHDLLQYNVNTDDASTNEYCYTAYVRETTTAATEKNLGTFCMNEDNYPLTMGKAVAFTGGETNTGYTLTGGVETTGRDRSTRAGFYVTISEDGSKCFTGSGHQMGTCSKKTDLGLNVPEEGRKNLSVASGMIWNNAPEMYVVVEKRTGSGGGSQMVSYEKPTRSDAWKDFVRALTGQDADSFRFSDADKYDFYLQYLKHFYGRANTAIGSATCEASKPASLVNASANQYYIYIKGSGWCLANLDSNKVNTQHTMTVFTASERQVLNNVIDTLPQLIELMGQLDYSDESALTNVEQSGTESGAVVTPGGTTDSGTGGTTGDASEGDPCYNTGIEGMSWILCPALNNMQSTASALERVIRSWLSVDTNLYGSDSAANKVWSYMRDIANVILIIILLVVIFSQLTGYGIDNYGIKKILPKLVVMAIVINLSYIICQLAIDLSNIFGVGLDNMFRAIGEQVIGEGNVSILEGFVSYAISVIFALLGVAGAVAPTGIAIDAAVAGMGEGAMVMGVIMIVLALIVVIVAILLFFLMLGARMIIVIFCAAVSPIALACYILPNTQKFTKQWWNLFKAALLIFPICGALGGVSYIVKAIVATADDVHIWMWVVAIFVPYLPFFLLPTLLRSSIAALGKVGGALTMMGGALRNGTRSGRSAVESTAAYKNGQERIMQNRNLRRTGFEYNARTGQIMTDANGQPVARRMNRLQRFMSGGDAGVARARAQALRDIDSRNRENEMLGTGFASAMAGVQAKADAQRASEYEALLGYGNINTVADDGTTVVRVNTGDAGSMGTYHRRALEAYAVAAASGDQAGMSEAMAQIKAAQNIMSKTDKGRTQVQRNFEQRLRNASSAADVQGLSDAAGHIMSNFGDKYKNVNRGAHSMIQELSTSNFNYNPDDAASAANVMSNVASMQGKLDTVDASGNMTAGAYTRAGVNKYTAESLANADEEAINRFVATAESMRGVLDSDGKDIGETLQATAYEALQKQQNGTLNIKPEVASQLQKIVGSDYVPQPKAGSNELYVRHEADAMRMGKSTIAVPPNILTGAPATSFEGYAVPQDFNHGGVGPVLDAKTGHYIYREVSGNRAWDTATGRYIRITPPSGGGGTP